MEVKHATLKKNEQAETLRQLFRSKNFKRAINNSHNSTKESVYCLGVKNSKVVKT